MTKRTPEETLEIMLKRVAAQDLICYDSETSGLDWRHNFICGHVLAFSPDPRDSYYLPVRHKGNANLGGVTGPRHSRAWDESIHPGEKALLSALDRKEKVVFGHNYGFDLKFKARTGAFHFNAKCEDTQINAPLLDEHQRSYSLETCAEIEGVQAKKSKMIVDYIRSRIPAAAAAPEKQAMGWFWELEGDDPMVVEYATGDGTTTWQLRDKQLVRIRKPILVSGDRYTDLTKVHGVENRLIRTLARMSFRGIKIDEQRLAEVIKIANDSIDRCLSSFPPGFNPKAPTQVEKFMRDNGVSGWPLTPTGKPSFPEDWLLTNEPGKRIVEVRKWETIRNSFLIPMRDEHVWRGRVHTTFNQLKNDDYGTVTGRLSSSGPNLQQVPKRNKLTAPLVRSIFVPDEGCLWASADYTQCLAAGTKVSVPGGTKNIEDIQVGDFVYSYDNNRRLTLKKVLWSGQTGVRPLVRLHWSTNGRTRGHVDVTCDHPVRLVSGEYKTAIEMSMMKHQGRTRGFPHWIPVLALRRSVQVANGYKAPYLHTTGRSRLKESRFVFETLNGWSPEEVHHIDEDSTNNSPENLEGLSKADHGRRHLPFGMGKLSKEERKKRSDLANRARAMANNHAITNIQPLDGLHPVYDITVEDTHNFIANEICVHNCEPVLLAHYSESKVLLEGYRANPPVDAHQAVANATGLDRETGKRVNQTLITGGGKGVLVKKYGVNPREVDRIWKEYFEKLPEIQKLQKEAAYVFRTRGYLLSLLGRQAHLVQRNKDYTAVNRLLQCGNADVIKLKMVEIDEYLDEANCSVQLINNIHDDLSFQFKPEDRPVYNECIRIMQDFSKGQMIELDLPLRCDPGEGKDWAEATFGVSK